MYHSICLSVFRVKNTRSVSIIFQLLTAVIPHLEELAKEYEGKLNIYKVDTEAEMELSAVFGIQSIPTFLFIPQTGLPMMQPGAFPKKVFKEVIEEKLLNPVDTTNEV